MNIHCQVGRGERNDKFYGFDALSPKMVPFP